MTGRSIFRQSVLANVLNPKAAVFFLAFFSQFVRAEQGSPQRQMVILGCVFVDLVMVCFGMAGLCSGVVGDWLKKKNRIEKRIGRIAGSGLILLGLKLARPH